METLRGKLYKYILVYGIQDKRTIETSQELDKLINKEIKKELPEQPIKKLSKFAKYSL